MHVRAAPKEHFEWLEARTGCVLTREARAIEAVDRAGRVRGMVAYDGWTDNSVQAHVALESPVVFRSLLRPAFEYPFLQAGKGVLLGLIVDNNTRSLAFAKTLGFREVVRLREARAVGVDLVVVEMRREECRWLKWRE